MGRIRQILGLEESAVVTETVARATAAESAVELLQEGMADLELMLEDRGWESLTRSGETEFSRDGLGRAARVARVMAVQNPLIKRGLGVRQAYVWGQGVQIQARATGKNEQNKSEQDVNRVVQAFLDDPGNRAAFTGDQAQEELERALGTDGNLLIAGFTSPRTGFVQARSIPFDEITDIIANPDDRDDPWYYKRVWTERTVDPTASRLVTMSRTAYYPAMTYRPRLRPKSIDGHPVMWDAPIYHVSVNRLDGWAFGIGDAYAALPWARAYKDFLADWATLVKALSQFAWKVSAKGSKSQAARRALARRPAGHAPDGNENNVGATVNVGEGNTLEAIPKTGATIDSESGRPLAAMVAAALDVPVTTLMADPGQTGARAVAETLNLPTRLAMQQRQSLWAEAYRAILQYVIHQATKAPQGPLTGTITRDEFTGRESLVLAGDTDTTIEIEWPPLDEVPVSTIVEAIAKADSTRKLPPIQIAKLLLSAFGVKDADEILDDLTDDDGNWLDPYRHVGDALTSAFRRGKNPAGLLGDEPSANRTTDNTRT
ncbi:hypothetical protein [Oerskovia paurometabola]|uniref:hypothetical protein n=1 Tax=Oerskovia paurometabola TaxID=162170 RepID=UPI00342414E1